MLKPTQMRMKRYFTFQIANNKGADQTARMRRLVCAFVVRKQQSQGFRVEANMLLNSGLRMTTGLAHTLYMYSVCSKVAHHTLTRITSIF